MNRPSLKALGFSVVLTAVTTTAHAASLLLTTAPIDPDYGGTEMLCNIVNTNNIGTKPVTVSIRTANDAGVTVDTLGPIALDPGEVLSLPATLGGLTMPHYCQFSVSSSSTTTSVKKVRAVAVYLNNLVYTLSVPAQ